MDDTFARVLLIRVAAQLAYQKVVGFDIAVNEVLLVNCLNTGQLHQVRTLQLYSVVALQHGKVACRGELIDSYHLFRHEDDSLQGEPSAADVEKVLQRGSQQVDDEDVVQTLLAKVVHIWDASCERLR